MVGNTDIMCDFNKSMPFEDNYADTVVACAIIEHLLNPYDFLKECYRILKPRGWLIITTPNGKCLFNPYIIGHIYCWDSIQNLQQLVEKAGFMVIKQSYEDIGDRNPFHRLVYILRRFRPSLFGVYEAVK